MLRFAYNSYLASFATLKFLLDRDGLGGLGLLGLGLLDVLVLTSALGLGRLGHRCIDRCGFHDGLGLIVVVCAEIVLGIRSHLGIRRNRIQHGLGRRLRINRGDNLHALDTILNLRGCGLDENLTRRKDRAKLVANVDLGDAKDHREARIGLAILRTDLAVDNIAGSVLDGCSRGINDRDLLRLTVAIRELVLANVKLKLRVLVLRTRARALDETVLPETVLDHADLGLVENDLLSKRRPALNLHANGIRLARSILGLGTLAQKTALDGLERHN